MTNPLDGVNLLEWIGIGLLLAGLGGALLYLRLLSKRLRDRTKELEELKAQVLAWNIRLEGKVADRTTSLEAIHQKLQQTYLETVTALVESMSAKDLYLFGHSHNVAAYAVAIADELGLSKQRIERLRQGCELHDLGKIAIPDSILTKPGPLTPEEMEIVKQHPVWGARILEPLTFMKDITEMVHQEHERWDGSGYPKGLKGEQIRLEARIIAVADALDAMTSERPYRQRVSLEEAAAEIKSCAGAQFDSKVVEATLKAIREGKLTITAHKHRSHSGGNSR
ncbi:MAG: HD-GYP domain-containing protein [Candidatus Omnitrophica bacterium]|nr:HD-GYP domain-containing protein [Candidatus Omnitrophota bacterium]